jgi:L-proline cis-4-hydroxylase
MSERPLAAQCIGVIALDPGQLAVEIETIHGFEMQPCVGYATGGWSRCVLLLRNKQDGDKVVATDQAAALPYLVEQIRVTFKPELVDCAYIFAAHRGGYVRPHCDWLGGRPLFTRLHIPLQTNNQCFNSEEDRVYHMRVGEIWFVDASLPHSGGCFSEETRLHLIIDLKPGTLLPDVFRDRASYKPSGSQTLIERSPFTAEHLAAIHGLTAIASDMNLPLILDLLGTIHFEKRVSCAAVYDWLIDIARGTESPDLIQRVAEFRQRYLTPFG